MTDNFQKDIDKVAEMENRIKAKEKELADLKKKKEAEIADLKEKKEDAERRIFSRVLSHTSMNIADAVYILTSYAAEKESPKPEIAEAAI